MAMREITRLNVPGPVAQSVLARDMVRRALRQLPGQHVYLFTDDSPEFYESIGFSRRGIGLEAHVGEWLDNTPFPPEA